MSEHKYQEDESSLRETKWRNEALLMDDNEFKIKNFILNKQKARSVEMIKKYVSWSFWLVLIFLTFRFLISIGAFLWFTG